MSSSFPWPLWAALVIVGAGLAFAIRLLPPEVECSSPQLEIRRGSVTATFDAANHTHQLVTRILRVRLGIIPTGLKSGAPNFALLDHREISVTLVPGEIRHMRCEFNNLGPILPYGAEISILPSIPCVTRP